MKTVTAQQMKRMLINVTDEIVKNEPYLTEIDTIIGDGDHGTGMKRGFIALRAMLENKDFETVSSLFHATGLELVKTMGGASGVLFGTMFIGGLSKIGTSNIVTVNELAVFFESAYLEIQRRGKARAGQKTMLDALIPAAESLKESAELDFNIEESLKRAYDAAVDGVDETKGMKARVGRSKNFQDHTIGWPDPGAISISLIFKALYEGYINIGG